MLRIVLDTNIFISALIKADSLPDKLYKLWEQKEFDLITSPFQIEELAGVAFSTKMQRFIKTAQATRLLSLLDDMAYIVTPLTPIAYSKDPDDNYILATAIEGNADYLVTGDKRDLLSLEEVERIRIITVRQILEHFKAII